MGVYLNPGTGRFEEAVRSQIYVDKTLLIEETNKVLSTMQKYVCVSRPRRFGKSMAANMLVAYYEKDCDSNELFSSFKISGTKSYFQFLNQFHVIAINMQSFLSVTSSVGEMITLLEEEVMEELKEVFPEMIPERIKRLSMALDKVYAKTKEKFVFVIDEWDCLLRERKEAVEEQKIYLDFIRNLFKDKEYAALVYMTGILPIKKYGSHSALNMFEEYSVIEPLQYAEYIGFTEEEVYKVCEDFEIDFKQMKNWYDGYMAKNVQHIYNPRSVVAAALGKSFGNYWTRTETYEALKIYVEMNYDGLKDSIVNMIQGNSVKINPDKFQNDMTSFSSKDDVLTLLIHLGYLAYNQDKSSVYIPNNEVRGEFRNAVEGAGWTEIIQMLNESEEILTATWNKEEEKVARMIDLVHSKHTSILEYNDENSLASVIDIAYMNAMNQYTKIREFPSGKGYADIVYLPKPGSLKPALVIELKYDESVQGAIAQIKNKRYVESLHHYYGNLLLIGINYDKKSKKHICAIEDYNMKDGQ